MEREKGEAKEALVDQSIVVVVNKPHHSRLQSSIFHFKTLF